MPQVCNSLSFFLGCAVHWGGVFALPFTWCCSDRDITCISFVQCVFWDTCIVNVLGRGMWEVVDLPLIINIWCVPNMLFKVEKFIVIARCPVVARETIHAMCGANVFTFSRTSGEKIKMWYLANLGQWLALPHVHDLHNKPSSTGWCYTVMYALGAHKIRC